MVDNARAWLVIGGWAAGIAGVMCLTCPAAVADPVPPPVPPVIAPVANVPLAATAPAAPLGATSGPIGVTPGPLGVTSGPATPPLAAPATPTPVPATSGALTDYFKTKNVRLDPQRAEGFQAFNITLPMPPGWSQVPDPNVPDAFGVIANRESPDLYTPNAQVVVYKLTGDFDPKEAITHGYIDSQSLPAWQTTDASLSDFCGLPSSIIEGTYRQNDMTLNTSRRHVIVTSGSDKYLVSLSVTSMASRQGAAATADATDAIVNGFKVVLPTQATQPPAH
jgi:hypothetical protein